MIPSFREPVSNYGPNEGRRVYATDAAADLSAFDELPAPLREALQQAPWDIAAEPIHAAWMNPDHLADLDCLERLSVFLRRIETAIARGVR